MKNWFESVKLLLYSILDMVLFIWYTGGMSMIIPAGSMCLPLTCSNTGEEAAYNTVRAAHEADIEENQLCP